MAINNSIAFLKFLDWILNFKLFYKRMELTLIWTITPFNGNPSNHENVMVAIIHFYLLQSRLFNIFSAELSLSNRYFNAIFLSSNSDPIFFLYLFIFSQWYQESAHPALCWTLSVNLTELLQFFKPKSLPWAYVTKQATSCNVIRILNSLPFYLFR